MVNLPELYPPANQTAQPRPKLAGGATWDHVEKLVLHTTETAGWPGYPTFAPHLTYDPWAHRWHQHFSLRRSATTLADPSSTGVRENRDFAIQVEIVAYCDVKLNKPGRGIDYLDDQAVRDLADFAAWLHAEGGLELELAPTWLPYPSSYGNSKARMSGPTFDAFRGILGHEHASGNDHGDPGAPPWLTSLLRYARAAAGQPSAPTPDPGKVLPLMATSTDSIWINSTDLNQELPAGEWAELKLNAKGDKTVVFGPSDGAEVLAVIGVYETPPAGPDGIVPDAVRVPVDVAFRVVSYKDGTTTVPVSTRQPDLPGATANFLGTIGKLDGGRVPRLRLVARAPRAGLVVRWLQVTGVEIKED